MARICVRSRPSSRYCLSAKVSLGFIANELITNAAKYGTGRITVSLESNPGKGCALSFAMMARICRKDSIRPLAKDWE